MKVFAFDRDATVDSGTPAGPVPLSWVRHLAHGTDHEVWAIGNQALVGEAAIPGIRDVLARHPSAGRGPSRRFPREERVLAVGELFPDAEAYVVVDDVNLASLEGDGWRHYYPDHFVTAVEAGDVGVTFPPAR